MSCGYPVVRLERFVLRAGSRSSQHRHRSGADQLEDSKWAEYLDEAVELLLRAGGLDDHRLRTQVDDPGTEGLHELQQLGAAVLRGANLHERHLARDGGRMRHVFDREDVDELVEVRFQPARG